MIRKFLFFLFSLPVLLGIYAFFIEPSWLRVREVPVQLPGSFRDLDGIRILEIGDMHFKSGRNEKQVLERAKRLRPDVIVLAGDMVEESSVIPKALRFVEKLPRDTKIYAVFGNWEYWSGIDLNAWKAELEKRGVKVLVNACDAVSVSGRTFVLAGVDDDVTRHADLDRTLENCPAGYRILVSHAPSIIEMPRSAEFPFIMAAHCHGGQVRLPWIGPLYLPKGCSESYYYGLIQKPGVTMYVTAGVGTSILPIRFMARPEIALIRLAASKKQEI